MLWNRVSGVITLRITAPEPERLLDAMVGRGLMLWDVSQPEALSLELKISRSDWRSVGRLVQAYGGKCHIRSASGLSYTLKRWCCRPLLIVALIILFLWSLAVSGTVLSVKVEGNCSVPDALILETAEKFGLSFGARTRQLRNEELKNQLLEQLPQLEWIGVNVSGCTAVISVRERQIEEETATDLPCNVYAAVDSIVDGITLHTGTLLCAPGQAVKQGQMLVSGCQDLGTCTRLVAADAEIYGLTLRDNCCTIPEMTVSAKAKGEPFRKYSLVCGKKRINLYSDSGILVPSCGKMTETKKLCLFGTLTIPVAVQIETFQPRHLEDMAVNADEAQNGLQLAATAAVEREMTAGSVRYSQLRTELSDGAYRLYAVFQCRELIGVQKSIAFWEGDTNDQ